MVLEATNEAVTEVEIVEDMRTKERELDRRKKGCQTVRFFNAEDAVHEIQVLNGVELQGHNLNTRYDSKDHY